MEVSSIYLPKLLIHPIDWTAHHQADSQLMLLIVIKHQLRVLLRWHISVMTAMQGDSVMLLAGTCAPTLLAQSSSQYCRAVKTSSGRAPVERGWQCIPSGEQV